MPESKPMPFISHAQNFEDVMLWRALRHVANGFYVDVGACEPDTDSVSLAFYERGWSGINIEPVAGSFARLAAARPRDINLQLACADRDGEADFLLVDQGNGLSTLQTHRETELRSGGWDVATTRVEVRTLSSILAQHAREPIHFLKIDAEGAEREVLAGAALDRWRPWIIVAEVADPSGNQPPQPVWEELLLGASYRMAYADGLNRFYIAAEHEELLSSFCYPPNVFDGFVRASPAPMEPCDPSRGALEQSRLSEAALAIERDAAWQELWETNRLVAHLAAERQKLLDEAAKPATVAPDPRLPVYLKAYDELATVYASTSWRITGPLRSLMHRVRGR